MKRQKIKIEPTFLGIARVIYDLEAVLEETIESLETLPDNPATVEPIKEAIVRIEAAIKALQSAPKKKVKKEKKVVDVDAALEKAATVMEGLTEGEKDEVPAKIES